MNKIAILTIAAIVVTMTGILGTFAMSGTAFAQLSKDPGASGIAPDADPKDPDFDPKQAPDEAPGQLKEGPAEEFTPGQEGLESGIIGPM